MLVHQSYPHSQQPRNFGVPGPPFQQPPYRLVLPFFLTISKVGQAGGRRYFFTFPLCWQAGIPLPAILQKDQSELVLLIVAETSSDLIEQLAISTLFAGLSINRKNSTISIENSMIQSPYPLTVIFHYVNCLFVDH